jgi:hypothetical protein
MNIAQDLRLGTAATRYHFYCVPMYALFYLWHLICFCTVHLPASIKWLDLTIVRTDTHSGTLLQRGVVPSSPLCTILSATRRPVYILRGTSPPLLLELPRSCDLTFVRLYFRSGIPPRLSRCIPAHLLLCYMAFCIHTAW